MKKLYLVSLFTALFCLFAIEIQPVSAKENATIVPIVRTQIEKDDFASEYTVFECKMTVLTKDEGGRRTPFFNKHKANFLFGEQIVEGICQLPEVIEMVMPGDEVVLKITLTKAIPIKQGMVFEMQEGGRPTGLGQVTKIIE